MDQRLFPAYDVLVHHPYRCRLHRQHDSEPVLSCIVSCRLPGLHQVDCKTPDDSFSTFRRLRRRRTLTRFFLVRTVTRSAECEWKLRGGKAPKLVLAHKLVYTLAVMDSMVFGLMEGRAEQVEP